MSDAKKEFPPHLWRYVWPSGRVSIVTEPQIGDEDEYISTQESESRERAAYLKGKVEAFDQARFGLEHLATKDDLTLAQQQNALRTYLVEKAKAAREEGEK